MEFDPQCPKQCLVLVIAAVLDVPEVIIVFNTWEATRIGWQTGPNDGVWSRSFWCHLVGAPNIHQ